jgi:hypothetical protein
MCQSFTGSDGIEIGLFLKAHMGIWVNWDLTDVVLLRNKFTY